jgi:hypothetical protein
MGITNPGDPVDNRTQGIRTPMQLLSSDRSATARTAVISSLDVFRGGPDERFDRITRAAREAFSAPLVALNMVDATTVRPISPVEPASAGVEPAVYDIRQAFCGWTVERPEPLIVADAREDDRFVDLDIVRGEPHIRFYAGVPLSTPGGTRIGTLCVLDTEPRDVAPEDVELLTELGRWAERVIADGRRADDLAAVIRAAAPAPIEVPGWSIAARSVGGHDLEGGFHDWAVSPAGVDVTVADVLGDGHGAGILAASVRSALRARAGQSALDAVDGTDRQVADELSRAASHVALFHARIDPDSGRFDWVDAGLGVAVVIRTDGTSEILRSNDLPIGLQPTDAARTVSTTVIGHGDTVLIATQGFLRLHDGTLETLELAAARLRQTGGIEQFFDQVDDQASRRQVLEGITAVVITRD